HVTCVWPSGNTLPEDGMHVTAKDPSTRSVADTANGTVAPAALVATAVTASGTVTCGGGGSGTVTVNVCCALLPAASWAPQVTVVVPTGKNEPEAGAHERTGAGSWSSVAVTT